MNISIPVYILDRHTRKVNGEIDSELGKNVILRFATYVHFCGRLKQEFYPLVRFGWPECKFS